jgi:NADPH:quinone reductase
MLPSTTLMLQSTVREDGRVEIEQIEVALTSPSDDEVVVRMEAAPINPSDLGTMFAGADITTLRDDSSNDRRCVSAALNEAAVRAAKARLGQSIPLGNEGAGIVVAAGASEQAQQLLGATVALRAGSYTQFRCIAADHCLVLPEGTDPAAAASCFVNPLTALGMVDTMRLEGHTALIHTAAASNLGQMLQRICLADDVALVNIVRSAAQEETLRAIGAKHVCNMKDDDFEVRLADAIEATGATLAFDATGGGDLASRILASMESALTRGSEFNRYGSTVHKQVYLYGSLQPGPVVLKRSYGMAWGTGGWLLTNFLRRVGGDRSQELMARVANEITSTFASRYTETISLAGVLDIATIGRFEKKGTGEKFLVAQHG